MPDADEGGDEGVAARLRQHALAGIDEDDREIGGRGAGRHVAGVLLVTRCVGDDEGAAGGGEIAIGDVDGDALLALGLQAVEQQRIVEPAIGPADAGAVGLERRDDVVGNGARLVEQAAKQGRLAVIDRAAGDEAQQRAAGRCGIIGRGRQRRGGLGSEGAHQKYPSCFFSSMEPALSKSIRRPWRSEEREARISAMISGTVVAVLSTAPVSG